MKLSSRCEQLLLCVLVVASLGCQPSDLNRRLTHSIRFLEKYWPDEKELLKKLKGATSQSLTTPDLVYVKVFCRPGTPIMLLRWIEATPTPDAVLIRNTESGYRKVVSLDALYAEENRREGRTGVVFRFVTQFRSESEEWKELSHEIEGVHAEGVLLLHGDAVSNSVPILRLQLNN